MTRTARGRHPSSDEVTPDRPDDTVDQTDSHQQGALGRARHSFLHNRSVRVRVAGLVFIPLLGALLFGASVFYNAVSDYRAASELEQNANTSRAVLNVVNHLQDERDRTALYLASVTGDGWVIDARDATDASVAELQQRFADSTVDPDSPVGETIATAESSLATLDEVREGSTNAYRGVIRDLLAFITATGANVAQSGISDPTLEPNEPTLVEHNAELQSVAATTESASMERGLLARLLAIGDDVEAARDRYVAVAPTEQELLIQPFAVVAPTDQWIAYTEATKPVDEIRRDVTNPAGRSFSANEWYEASTERIDVLRDIQNTISQQIVHHAGQIASSARWTAIVTAGVVLAVLALTVVVAYAVARSIVRPLRRLRGAALDTANTGLPALVSRIRDDGPAAVRHIGDAVQPEGRDEIGQVAQAFNEVHATAVRVAGEQALLRQNLDTIVVNLSRRTQSLVDRQLGEIEDLESRERDPDQLGTLFRIDHLATRVRRHSESLLVLAGVEEMRRQGVAAPVLDVVRTAVGEVEQYPRVKFGVMPTDLVVPAAVDDVAHLLAELLDNATEFSAPSTPVTITSQPLLGGGLRLQVTDSGLGIPPDQLTILNDRLREPGDIDVAASRTLGIYVVARLGARHGITVRLIPAEGTTGTIAQVDLPAHLIVSPLDTTDGVLQAIRSEPAEARRVDTDPQIPAPAVASLPTSLPSRPTSAPTPISAPAAAPAQPGQARPVPLTRPSVDTNQPAQAPPSVRPTPPLAPRPGTREPLPTRPTEPAPIPVAAQPATARSLRAPQPELPEGDSPIYDSVRSAWFSRGKSLDWTSPADEGWRRAAEAVRTAEDAAMRRAAAPPAAPPPGTPRPAPGVSSRPAPAPWSTGRADRPPPQQPVPAPTPPRTISAPPPARPAQPPATPPPPPPAPAAPAGVPGASRPAAQSPAGARGGEPNRGVPQRPEPAAPAPDTGGLPTRQRGATLVPGSIPAGEQAPASGAPAAANASNVASTLANLQRGVSRGRQETGGWVPKRPNKDAERSDK